MSTLLWHSSFPRILLVLRLWGTCAFLRAWLAVLWQVQKQEVYSGVQTCLCGLPKVLEDDGRVGDINEDAGQIGNLITLISPE